MKKLLATLFVIVFVILTNTHEADAMKTRLINFDYNGGDFITTWEFDLDEDGFWDGWFTLQGGEIKNVFWYPFGKSKLLEDNINKDPESKLKNTNISVTNDKLYINFDDLKGIKYITIFNLSGNKIYSTNINNYNKVINIANIVNGNYFIIIKTPVGIKTEKFIINK